MNAADPGYVPATVRRLGVAPDAQRSDCRRAAGGLERRLLPHRRRRARAHAAPLDLRARAGSDASGRPDQPERHGQQRPAHAALGLRSQQQGKEIANFVLFADDQPISNLGATELQYAVGAFDPNDSRSFSIVEIDTARQPAASAARRSRSCRSSPGSRSNDARNALNARGFGVGAVTVVDSSTAGRHDRRPARLPSPLRSAPRYAAAGLGRRRVSPRRSSSSASSGRSASCSRSAGSSACASPRHPRDDAQRDARHESRRPGLHVARRRRGPASRSRSSKLPKSVRKPGRYSAALDCNLGWRRRPQVDRRAAS